MSFFFCNPQVLLKKISIILALFWQKKQALLLAFNAFFTSTFGKSLDLSHVREHPRSPFFRRSKIDDPLNLLTTFNSISTPSLWTSVVGK